MEKIHGRPKLFSANIYKICTAFFLTTPQKKQNKQIYDSNVASFNPIVLFLRILGWWCDFSGEIGNFAKFNKNVKSMANILFDYHFWSVSQKSTFYGFRKNIINEIFPNYRPAKLLHFFGKFSSDSFRDKTIFSHIQLFHSTRG